MLRALVLWLMLSVPAVSEEIVLGLSHDQVGITATFDGTNVLIFGAVKRTAPIPSGAPLDVIITLAGPPVDVDIRRKSRRAGIWVNTDSVRATGVPSFYAVASTAPLPLILSDSTDSQYRISVRRALLSPGTTGKGADIPVFLEALVRIQARDDLFQDGQSPLALEEETLFQTSVDLPSNLVEGQYTTRIFLLRDGVIVDTFQTSIDVAKVGLERWLYTLAHAQPLVYGIMSLLIAIVAGWLASAVFRAFQR
ncbi:TIGR02186 family protein [Pseudoruegeria sp. SK021]|uniref:TIGR02186 family protein n=1 Tax=Pseudoruegeria sp. SK021 TaxID=1933035 RepID=UPI000A23ACFB|nr:TIGR02186 family protein [Pseudoruegeria sp. SK021]OSP56085.1 hypothetical protein BV911_03875 [Pseudoruegeria sp. SK021]